MSSRQKIIVHAVPMGWLIGYFRMLALLAVGVLTAFSKDSYFAPLCYLGLASLVFREVTRAEKLLVAIYYLALFLAGYLGVSDSSCLPGTILILLSLGCMALLSVEANGTSYVLSSGELVVHGLCVEDLSIGSRRIRLGGDIIVRAKEPFISKFSRVGFEEIEIVTREGSFKLRGVPRESRLSDKIKRASSASRVVERVSRDSYGSTHPEIQPAEVSRRAGEARSSGVYRARGNLIDELLP
ncbi:MAG: hypothetical protein LM590_02150 [Thermofilum sp.]|nr:hypothetical protein [Thermofilum sp.]